MLRRIVNITITTLAILLTLMSFQNLNTASAGLCDGVCGCVGGDLRCCTYQGVTCYTSRIRGINSAESSQVEAVR